MKKKKYVVMPRNTRIAQTGLKTDRGVLDFKGKSMMYLNSDELAGEVDGEYGLNGSGDVWVHTDPRAEHQLNYHADPASKSFFGATKAFTDAWERIFKNKGDIKCQE